MERDIQLDIGLSIMEGGGIEWRQETNTCILYKCKQYGHYFVTDLDGSMIVPPGRYSYMDKFWKGYSRVNTENRTTGEKQWGIIDSNGVEVVPIRYDCIWKFYGRNHGSTYMLADGTHAWFDLTDGTIYKYNPECRGTGISIGIGSSLKDRPKYGEFEGSYAQSVMGLSDDVINDAFDGEPDAYWNID